MKLPKLKTSTVLISVGLFLLFLLLAFPFQNLKGYIFGQIYKSTRILIVADEIYLSIFGWPGIGIRNVDATFPVGREELSVSAENMVVRVGIGSLFPPSPSITLDLSGLHGGGDLYVRASKAGGVVHAYIDADEVDLSQFDFPGLQSPVQGVITADADLAWNEADLAKSQGEITLKAVKLVSPPVPNPMFPLPSMEIGGLDAKIYIRNGAIEANKFQLGDPTSGVRGTVEGNLRLGKDLLASFLDLTLRIELAEKYRNDPQASALVSVLKSFERSPGDYGMKWNSSLGGMMSNVMNALPQKIDN